MQKVGLSPCTIIDIDAQNGKVIVKDPSIQTMPSWKLFGDNGEKMIIPNFDFLK